MHTVDINLLDEGDDPAMPKHHNPIYCWVDWLYTRRWTERVGFTAASILIASVWFASVGLWFAIAGQTRHLLQWRFLILSLTLTWVLGAVRWGTSHRDQNVDSFRNAFQSDVADEYNEACNEVTRFANNNWFSIVPGIILGLMIMVIAWRAATSPRIIAVHDFTRVFSEDFYVSRMLWARMLGVGFLVVPGIALAWTGAWVTIAHIPFISRIGHLAISETELLWPAAFRDFHGYTMQVGLIWSIGIGLGAALLSVDIHSRGLVVVALAAIIPAVVFVYPSIALKQMLQQSTDALAARIVKWVRGASCPDQQLAASPDAPCDVQRLDQGLSLLDKLGTSGKLDMALRGWKAMASVAMLIVIPVLVSIASAALEKKLGVHK